MAKWVFFEIICTYRLLLARHQSIKPVILAHLLDFYIANRVTLEV